MSPVDHLSASPSESASGLRSRPLTIPDGAEVWKLVAASTLDDNSPYAYLLWGDHFGATSRIVRETGADDCQTEGRVLGFVMGFAVPDRPHALFVWQVGVAPEARGRGVASVLLDDIWAEHPQLRCLEATVTPDNTASDRLFRSFARRHGLEVTTEVAYREADFPTGDHEAEIRYRICPPRAAVGPAASDDHTL